MKTVFDKATRDDLINRINLLNENSIAQWGKMNVHQMTEHCIMAEEMLLGKTRYKRAFIGRLIGKVALKNMLKNGTGMPKSAPTKEEFKINEVTADLSAQKKKWVGLVEEYADFSSADYIHWFFGKMTKEEVGYFAYIHSDHHLQQFNN